MVDFDGLYMRGTIRLTPGRIVWSARSIERRLTPDEVRDLVVFVQEAEAAGRAALALAESRADSRRPRYGKQAKTKDTSLDAVASAIHGQNEGLARVYPEGHEVGDAARRVNATFFPRGLHAVTNASYPDELAKVERMVELAKTDLAADVGTLGLGPLVAALEERAAELAAVLERAPSTAPTRDDITAAVLAADRRMAELVMAVLVRHAGDRPEALRRKAEILEPYELQQEGMRLRYRQRLAIGDVDPDTGELDEPAGTDATPSAEAKKARELAE